MTALYPHPTRSLRSLVEGGGLAPALQLTTGSTPAVASRSLGTIPLAFGAVVPPPVRMGEGLVLVVLAVGNDLAEALAFPPWTGTVLTFGGLCTFLIGVMAWLASRRDDHRAWGRRVAVSGVSLTIVGFAFQTFLTVIEYVLTG